MKKAAILVLASLAAAVLYVEFPEIIRYGKMRRL